MGYGALVALSDCAIELLSLDQARVNGSRQLFPKLYFLLLILGSRLIVIVSVAKNIVNIQSMIK